MGGRLSFWLAHLVGNSLVNCRFSYGKIKVLGLAKLTHCKLDLPVHPLVDLDFRHELVKGVADRANEWFRIIQVRPEIAHEVEIEVLPKLV